MTEAEHDERAIHFLTAIEKLYAIEKEAEKSYESF